MTWTVSSHQNVLSQGWIIRDEDGSAIAAVLGTPNGEMFPHANLIASAPELLKGLTGLVEDLEQLSDEFGVCREIMQSSYGLAARKAIKKARGEE